ncbi:hypothetical protein ACIHIX_47175 [Streptomyces sp. NPDC051913]|uniref:hypothetical protein n=1 Tax=Streptomyces sp. NPDC051913 TaxID=3365676 RepID=UPI0037D2DF44
MINMGVRIEFYESVGQVGELPEGYLGALERTEGYRAAAVPQIGTSLMAASLRVVDRETARPLPGPVQLPVRAVEHHLVPEREGKAIGQAVRTSSPMAWTAGTSRGYSGRSAPR